MKIFKNPFAMIIFFILFMTLSYLIGKRSNVPSNKSYNHRIVKRPIFVSSNKSPDMSKYTVSIRNASAIKALTLSKK